MTENTTASPIAPAPHPPGDFANDPFFQSPSTWLAIVAGLSPIITVLLKDDAPAVIEALSGLGPTIAFVALIIQRNMNHRNVQQLNLRLAQERIAANSTPPVVDAVVMPAMEYAGAEITELRVRMSKLEAAVKKPAAPPRKR